MGRAAKIARRTFLIGTVAVAGGVAFGTWRYKTPYDNPLLDCLGEGEAAMDPRWGPLAALKQRLEAQAPKGPAATAADQNDSEEQE